MRSSFFFHRWLPASSVMLAATILAGAQNCEPSWPPLALTLEPAFESSGRSVPRPEAFTGHLHLDHQGQSVTGSLSLRWYAEPGLSQIAGQLSGDRIDFDAGEARVPPSGRLAWQAFTLTLFDADGDGVVDSAQGDMAGEWEFVMGDVIDSSPHTSSLTAGPDTEPAEITLAPDPRGASVILPIDSIGVRFSEPLADTNMASLRMVTAEGEVDGQLVFDPVHGLVVGATFQPTRFLPPAATLSLAIDGIYDPAGNPATTSGDVRRTVADPGVLTDNPDFENGLLGWNAIGEVAATGAFEGVPPASGDSQAMVREQSVVAGFLDVPQDANQLDLSIAVCSEAGQFDAQHSAVVTLHSSAGERYKVFDAFDFSYNSVPCDSCSEFGHIIPPARYVVDLRPYRGQRLMLTAEARSSYFFGVNYYAMLVDDLMIATESTR